jgi:hypothetical protein
MRRKKKQGDKCNNEVERKDKIKGGVNKERNMKWEKKNYYVGGYGT